MSPSFIFDCAAASPDLIAHNWRNGTILCHLIDDFVPSGQEVSLRSFKGRIIATKPMKTWANGQILDAEDVMFTADNEVQRQRLGFSVHGVVVSAGDIPIFYIGEVNGFPIDVSRGLLYRTVTIVWDNGPNKVADISDPTRMTSARTRAAAGGLSMRRNI